MADDPSASSGQSLDKHIEEKRARLQQYVGKGPRVALPRE